MVASSAACVAPPRPPRDPPSVRPAGGTQVGRRAVTAARGRDQPPPRWRRTSYRLSTCHGPRVGRDRRAPRLQQPPLRRRPPLPRRRLQRATLLLAASTSTAACRPPTSSASVKVSPAVKASSLPSPPQLPMEAPPPPLAMPARKQSSGGQRRAIAEATSMDTAEPVKKPRRGGHGASSSSLSAPSPAEGDHFGYALALTADFLAVGAPNARSNRGAVLVFGRGDQGRGRARGSGRGPEGGGEGRQVGGGGR